MLIFLKKNINILHYLLSAVEPFTNIFLSETVLKRLLTQNIFFKSKQVKDVLNTDGVLYQAGKPADYFVLILEGRCRVTVCKENLVFETGPFSYFGIPAITVNVSPGMFTFLLLTFLIVVVIITFILHEIVFCLSE